MLLINPDIHGRTFWKSSINNINEYDKIIFLGDYLDPYQFEGISVKDSIDNFKDIINFKKENQDKVILLLGNHDLPYYSETYYKLSTYHCRHSKEYHKLIHKLFNDNKSLFQLAYAYNDILFTHAGCRTEWLNIVFGKDYDISNINNIVFDLNNLLSDNNKLQYLYMVSRDRGGYDLCGSCVWEDVRGMIDGQNDNELNNIKQIFGHTLQAYYGVNHEILYGNIIEQNNIKMLDNCKSYILDADNFIVKSI